MDTEYIMCSAIWYDDGIKRPHTPKCVSSGYVICGFRHHDCFGTLSNTLGLGNYDKSKIIQGFLTSHNRFLGRESSKDVAIDSGQLHKHHKGRLYSEDLW